MRIGDELNKIKIKTDYKRSGIDCCLDPFRKKLIPVTKEEIVRQRIAVFLRDKLDVPEDYIFTEESLHHWGIDSKDRADIIIGYQSNNTIYPLCIVECKSPEVNLSFQTYSQCLKYVKQLKGNYCFITNGNEIIAWYFDGENTHELRQLPTYQEMLDNDINFDETEQEIYYRHSIDEIYYMTEYEYFNTGFIGEDTPDYLWEHIVNMGECFYDIEHKMKRRKANNIRIIEDLGCNDLNYDDASGGGFGSGKYRSILIEDKNGNNQIISFGIMPTGKTINDPKYGNSEGKSVLVVSLQDFKTDYTVVQINLNKYLEIESGKLRLWHNGAVMQKGGRKEELIRMVQEENSSLVQNGKINLGTLPIDKLMYLDSKEVSDTLCNLIAYSLIRNEYKQHLSITNKNQKNKG